MGLGEGGGWGGGIGGGGGVGEGFGRESGMGCMDQRLEQEMPGVSLSFLASR